MEHDSYRLWEVLGTWVSGIGTVGAVIVLLWLASRSERPRLKILVARRIVISGVPTGTTHVTPKDFPDILYVEVTNTSAGPVHIVSVGWMARFPWWLRFMRRGRTALSQNPPDARSHPWPTTLQQGQFLQWQLDPELILKGIVQYLLARSRLWRLHLRYMRLVVATSVSTSYGELDRGLVTELAAKTRAARSAR
jgi:hypothetical protein